MKKLTLFLCLIAFVFIFTSCKQDKNEISIGAIISLTGDNALQGELAQNGILTAIEYINTNGGINGKKVNIIIEDSQTTAKGTINAFKKLVSLNKITALLITGDTEFIAVNTLAEQAKIPIMATTCTGMLDKGRSSWLFRYCFNERAQADNFMKYIKINLGMGKLAFIMPNSVYGQEIDKYAKDSFHALGGNSVSIFYDTNSTDQRSTAMKAIQTNPEAVYVRGFGSSYEAILRSLGELKYDGLVLGDLVMSLPTTYNNTKGCVNGAYVIASELDVKSKKKIIRDYVENYKEKYNIQPCFWDALGFDSMIFLAKGIELGKQIPEKVKNALYDIDSIELLLGNNHFDKNNDAIFDMSVYKIEENGKLNPVK